MARRIDPLKAKQARQKKIAIGLGVVFVAVLAFQGPKTLKMLKGPQQTAAPQATTPTPTPTTTSGTPGAGAPAPDVEVSKVGSWLVRPPPASPCGAAAPPPAAVVSPAAVAAGTGEGELMVVGTSDALPLPNIIAPPITRPVKTAAPAIAHARGGILLSEKLTDFFSSPGVLPGCSFFEGNLSGISVLP